MLSNPLARFPSLTNSAKMALSPPLWSLDIILIDTSLLLRKSCLGSCYISTQLILTLVLVVPRVYQVPYIMSLSWLHSKGLAFCPFSLSKITREAQKKYNSLCKHQQTVYFLFLQLLLGAVTHFSPLCIDILMTFGRRNKSEMSLSML